MNYETKSKYWTDVLNVLCRQVEDHMGLPDGELKDGVSDRYNTLGRDAIVEEAFNNYEIPFAFLATYLNKTGQGVRNALQRQKDRERIRKFFADPIPFEDIRDTIEDDPEVYTEGRIYKHKNQTYED